MSVLRRHSPREPCPYCKGMTWTLDQEKLRWECEHCATHPDLELDNFNDWYKSAMDDWNTASGMLASIERDPEPEGARDKLIQRARKIKAEEEFRRADVLATTACTLKILVDTAQHGEFSCSIPDYEIEVSYKW